MPSKEQQKLGAPLLEQRHAPKAAMPDDMYVCIIDCLHGSIISKSPAVYLSSVRKIIISAYFAPIFCQREKLPGKQNCIISYK